MTVTPLYLVAMVAAEKVYLTLEARVMVTRLYQVATVVGEEEVLVGVMATATLPYQVAKAEEVAAALAKATAMVTRSYQVEMAAVVEVA